MMGPPSDPGVNSRALEELFARSTARKREVRVIIGGRRVVDVQRTDMMHCCPYTLRGAGKIDTRVQTPIVPVR